MSLLKQPLHPGEVLQELYLLPLQMSAIAFANRLRVPRTRIERLIRGETAVSPDTAMRLSKLLNTSPEYWSNLQRNYDLARARQTVDVSDIVPLEIA